MVISLYTAYTREGVTPAEICAGVKDYSIIRRTLQPFETFVGDKIAGQ